MRHKMGNSVRCDECQSYKERIKDEKMKSNCTGWCTNKKVQGINGHKPSKEVDRTQVAANGSCRWWIDMESGYTRFEVETGYKEPYDGSMIILS